MNDAETTFVRLYAIEGKTYAEIEKVLACDRAYVRELHSSTADQCRYVLNIKAICSRKNIKDFEKFYSEYIKLKNERFYCGITQEQINLLFERKKIQTKRSTTRGRRLELERLEPNESYENTDNLRLACYWCNNAKSDEFSVEEFKPIAEGIGRALKARLL